MKNIRQYLILLLFLVVFPGVSWLYLQRGMNYRMEALEKLEALGTLSPYRVPAGGGDTLDLEALRGQVVVASFFSLEDATLADLFGDRLQALYGQFGGRPEVVFLQHLNAGATEKEISRFTDEHALNDAEQCRFVLPETDQRRQLMAAVYELPEYEAGAASSPYIALADTSLMLRRYYDVRQEASMRELVEHLAIVIPPIKERDLVFKREKEK